MNTGVFALDTNLVLAVDARRFLCAMQETTGGEIVVTEQVHREACSLSSVFAQKAARKESVRLLEREPSMSEQDLLEYETRRTLEIADRTEAWFEGERARNDAAWRYVPRPPHSRVLQAQLLSTPCLTDADNRGADAWVVAEAVLSGATVLAADNLRSIRHGVLNHWLKHQREKGNRLVEGVPDTFVMDPDTAVQERVRRVFGGAEAGSPRRFGRRCLEWALGACVPDEGREPDRVSGIVRRFLSNLRAKGLEAVAEASVSVLEDMGETGFAKAVSSVRLPERTRGAEDRRLGAGARRVAARGVAAAKPAPT